MVGKYHIQVASLEGMAIPILDAVLAQCGGHSASPSGPHQPRLLIFDEIGKMELFSQSFVQRICAVLSSPDAQLHVLGTLALRGPGLISDSKRLPHVEVIEIDRSNRDCAAADLSGRLAALLGKPRGAGTKESALPEESLPAVASEAPAPSLSLARPVPFATFDFPEPGRFSAVYLSDPPGNFASLNAGDYELYVGGAAINKAFADALQACGQETRRFEALHAVLLRSKAAHEPGCLAWLQAEELEDEALLDNLAAFCGLLPRGRLMEQLRPVGLVSIAVFRAGHRPCDNERNVAMVYTIGPHCGNKRTRIKRDVDNLSVSNFLVVIESVGDAVGSAVAQYNARALLDSALPRIEVLRVCLLSGGVYKHPEAAKVEVATALVRGLLARLGDRTGRPEPPLTLDFAYDEDVFRRAWRDLGLPEADPGARPTEARPASAASARARGLGGKDGGQGGQRRWAPKAKLTG